MPLALIATYHLAPGTEAAFLARVCRQRDDTLAREPGCRHFDVTVRRPDDEGPDVVLYEIYDDEAALAEHRTFPHFHDYKAATAAMVASLQLEVRQVLG